jgi:hypothetical protein
MSYQPTVYYVSPEQVGQQDINYFLQQAIARQFEGHPYCIVNEQTLDRLDRNRPGTLRKIKSYLVEASGTTHSLYFDITDVSIVNSKTAGWA